MKRKNICAAIFLTLMISASGQRPEIKRAPGLNCTDGIENWGKAFPEVYRVLLINLREPAPPFSAHFAVPGPQFKNEVYLWDTGFIALVWKWWDTGMAQEIFLPLFQIQKKGMIPHSNEQTRDSQPPILSWSVSQIYQISKDKAFLEKAYGCLREYNNWLYEHRRMKNGLFFWDNRFESGLDNSPRFTNRSATKSIKMDKIAAVDMCVYMVKDNQALAEMAESLGRNADASGFRAKAQEIKDLVNKHLWDETDGMYYDYDFGKNRFIKINTNVSFLPLFAGIPSEARAKKLVGRIMDPAQYNTLIPLPTVALNDSNYFLDMWRGPVWVNADYMIILGMKDYGFKKEAAELSWKIADALFKVWEKDGKFYEFYDPQKLEITDLHRKTGFMGLSTRRDKPVEDFVGWTGLVNNLVIEVLFGLEKTETGWALSPALPASASGKTLLLTLPSQNLYVTLEVDSPDRIKALVVKDHKQSSFELGAGKSARF